MPFRYMRKNWRSGLKWLYLLVGLTGGVIAYQGLTFEKYTDSISLQGYFENRGVRAEVLDQELAYQGRVIRVSESDSISPLLVFIHGAPGSGMAFGRYLLDPELRQRFEMISVDRPGYSPDDNFGSYRFNTQVKFLNSVIEYFSKPDQEVFLISHSYGGPIGILSAEINSKIKGHIMLSSVMEAKSEPVFFVSPLPLIWPFTFISSPAMRFSAVEKLHHQRQLINHLTNRFATKRHQTRTWLVHGIQDWLAPMDNVQYGKSIVDPEMYHEIILEDASHFIPWTRYDRIKALILELL